MPGTVLSVLPHAILATFHLRDVVRCCPTLQVRKLRLREAKFLLYSRARKCPLGLKPGLPDPQTIPHHLIPISCGPEIHFLWPKTTVLPLGVDHGAPNVTTTWSLPHRSPHLSLTTVSSVVSELSTNSSFHHNGSHRGLLVNSPHVVLDFFSSGRWTKSKGDRDLPLPK